MHKDLYNFNQGVTFAKDMLVGIGENISLRQVIENLRRALGNKPQAQQDGILSVIELLEHIG